MKIVLCGRVFLQHTYSICLNFSPKWQRDCMICEFTAAMATRKVSRYKNDDEVSPRRAQPDAADS